MSDISRDAEAHDEDRLPWLEAAEDDEPAGVSFARLATLVVAALVALGLVIGGVWYLGDRSAPPAKDPTLIAAQEGDYKVRPSDAGGMKVEGRGDSAFATSEGAEANGKIDLNRLPETPVKGVKGTTAADAAAKPASRTTVAVGKTGGALVAAPPTAAGGAASGRLVQLGAFGSEAKAAAAGSALAQRYAFLVPLTRSVVKAEVGGATVYRLRADAGAQATSICAKLRSAGENCLPVN